MSEPKPETVKSIEFLKKWSPKGPWILTAIETDRSGIATACFLPKNEAACIKWINSFNGSRNIYFTVNNTKGEITRKPSKGQMKSAGWLHVDIDPPVGADIEAARPVLLGLLTDNLPKGLPKPTVIIFSGGGYQGFWKLKDQVEVDGDPKKIEEFELYNKKLEQLLQGDHCHNIDRIMRLPGTINVPNKKKMEAGRTKQLAKLLAFTNKSYDLSDFSKKTQSKSKPSVPHDGGSYGEELEISGELKPIQDLSELDVWKVPTRVKVIIGQGRDPDNPKEKDDSRSSWLFDCVCNLVRAGVPDDVIFNILMDPGWGISESVLEAKPNAEKYAIRQIRNAKEWTEDPELRELNEKHAVIGNYGGKCRIIEEVYDSALKRSRLTVSSFEDIRNRYSNRTVQVGVDKDGHPVHAPLGKWWLGNLKRRQFDYIKFLPNGEENNVYNLWRGFAVSPGDGDCSKYLEHVKENVCGGDEELFQYVIKWMARAVQEPGTQGEVAIVIRGGKGTGKGVFANEFGKLFGRHFLQIANPSHLVGNFNAHLRDVIVLFADEAFFAGDKKHESVLKMLITEDSIPIESKGIDTEPYANYTHLIMAANDPHVIRATGDERRYLVLESSDKQQQNSEYFSALTKQQNEGGREALLQFLQNVDLTDFQVRNVPQTEALQEQKLLSLSSEEEWWHGKLKDGTILDHNKGWHNIVACEDINIDYTRYMDQWKINRRGNATSLGRFLNRVASHMTRRQATISREFMDSQGFPIKTKARTYIYNFGSLEKCRQAWDKIHGSYKWEKPLELIEEAPEEKQKDLIEPPF